MKTQRYLLFDTFIPLTDEIYYRKIDELYQGGLLFNIYKILGANST